MSSSCRKGYRAPGAVLVLLAALTVSLSLMLPFLPSGVACGRSFPVLGVRSADYGVLGRGVHLVAVLPSRSARVSGERHVNFPFVLVGWTVGAAGFVVTATALWFWFSGRPFPLVVRTLWLAGVLIAFGTYLVRRGQAIANQPVLERVLADDPRSPVPYLRGFNRESQGFAVGDASNKYGAYVEGWQRVAIAGQRVEVPFEQYFHHSLETRLGLFVALGSPEDYVPPHGAVRHYASDETWQPELTRLAKQARCIVAEVNTAGNLH